jgi:hypothetical protein
MTTINCDDDGRLHLSVYEIRDACVELGVPIFRHPRRKTCVLRLLDGSLLPLTSLRLGVELSRRGVRFTRRGKPIDPPKGLLHMVLKLGADESSWPTIEMGGVEGEP